MTLKQKYGGKLPQRPSLDVLMAAVGNDSVQPDNHTNYQPRNPITADHAAKLARSIHEAAKGV